MEKTFRRNIAPYRNKVRTKKGVSQFLLRKLTAPVDFVYVDGSHQAADVLEDAVLSFRLLNLGKTRSRKSHFFSRLQCATW